MTEENKSRFRAELEDGRIYDSDTPVTDKDRKAAQALWDELTGDQE
ncbi:hypothetical protein [Methanococcoides sp. NM1]|nr:hypothetical protein [Methanococcoides sp. NM1]